MIHNRTDPETERAICQAYINNELVTVIAATYGKCPAAVQNILTRNGIPKRGRGRNSGLTREELVITREKRVMSEESYTTPHVPQEPADLSGLDYRKSRAERAAAQLKSYYEGVKPR